MSPVTRISAPCTAIAGCPPTTATVGATAVFEHTAVGLSAETIDGSTTYYVRDPGGGLLSARTPTGTYYYLFDGQGSVVAMTNATGGVDATYAYDPYGQLTAMTSNGPVGINNPWRYVSAYQDGTGLYKLGARYYDPSQGRFTQQDPIHDPLDPKSWNRYTYVGDDPINFVDPTGLKSWWSSAWDFVKGCAAGVGKLGAPFVGGVAGFYAPYELGHALYTAEAVAAGEAASIGAALAGEFTAVSGATIFGFVAVAAVIGAGCYVGNR